MLNEMQTADIQNTTGDVSGPVTTSQENANWSGRQDNSAYRRALPMRASPAWRAQAQAVEKFGDG
jgi:hypothetical protein